MENYANKGDEKLVYDLYASKRMSRTVFFTMKNINKKRGISLIVLVITILVLSILATMVITSLSNTSVIRETQMAVFKQNMSTYKQTYDIYLMNVLLSDMSFDKAKVNLTYEDAKYQEIFGKVSNKYKEGLKVIRGKLVYITDDEDEIRIIQELGMMPDDIKIINRFVHCTTSNLASSVAYNTKYATTITVEPGYILQKVAVVMGGVDITESVYNSNDKTITIANVTDDVIITATTDANTYIITSSLTEVVSSNTELTVKVDASYTTKLSTRVGYTLTSVNVSIAGADVTDIVYDKITNEINIQKVTGDVIIVACAIANGQKITYSFSNVTSSNSNTYAQYGNKYTAVLSPTNTEYILKTVTVIMGGLDVTDEVYDIQTNTIAITEVTGDIDIVAEAEMEMTNTETSYVGYYADINGDGTVDGVIFADLVFGGKGEIGTEDEVTSYEIMTTTNAKEYYITQTKYSGSFSTTPLPVIMPKEGQDDKDDRFYVMSLSDFKNGAHYCWYSDAEVEGIPNPTTLTLSTFGKGKENTAIMVNKWNGGENTENGYGEFGKQNGNEAYPDLWGIIQNDVKSGWFVPSRDEWVAFIDVFDISDSNYAKLGLSGNYWSSSLSHSKRAWSVDCRRGQMYGRNGITGSITVRLAAIF